MSDMSTAAGSATLTDGEFQTFVRFASEEAGLSIPASKKSLVQSRVSKRLPTRTATCVKPWRIGPLPSANRRTMTNSSDALVERP